MCRKRIIAVILLVAVVALGAKASAGAQTLLIAGPGGRLVEVRRDGGFRLRLPGRPPISSSGILHAGGPQREFWLFDQYFGFMAHAEAVMDAGTGGTGHGRVEVYGPWPFGYVAFSGPAWDVETPDDEEEDEPGSLADGQHGPPRPGGGP